MDVTRHIDELRKSGVTLIPDVYSQNECAQYRNKLDVIFEKLVQKTKNWEISVNQDSQYIPNIFRHDHDLLNLIHQDVTDRILKVLLDDNYVLIDSTAINRKQRPDLTGAKPGGLGQTWHTDSRYLDNQRLAAGFSFIAVIMLNDFTVETGATHYIPETHKVRTVPERQGTYDFKFLEGKAGSIAILDSGIWHRGSGTSHQDRWGVFNLYGPWFMKPYFRFPDMLGPEFGKSLNKTYRRLLHFTSIPPLNEDERMNTLVKEI